MCSHFFCRFLRLVQSVVVGLVAIGSLPAGAVLIQHYDSSLNTLPDAQGWTHFEIDSDGTIAGGDANMELVDLGGADGVVLHVKDQLTDGAFNLPTFFYNASDEQKQDLFLNGFRLAFEAKNIGSWFVGFGFNDSAFELAANIGADQRIGFGVGEAPNDGAFHDFEVLGAIDGDNYNFTLAIDGGVPEPLAIQNNGSAAEFQAALGFQSGSSGGTSADAQFKTITLETRDLASPFPSVFVDRDTGEVYIDNNTAADVENIIGYSVLSTAGSLDQSSWNQQASGSQLAGDDDQWTVLTGAGVSTDLSEAVLSTSGAGDGGNLPAATGEWSFGNIWKKAPFEDVVVELLLDDGTVLSSAAADLIVEYIGTEALTADLAGATVNDGPDGDLNLVDWQKFRANVGTDVSALSAADAYLRGDLTGDRAINASDYTAFVAAFDAANGAGAFQAALAAVPEPATSALLAMGMLGIVGVGRRRQPAARQASSLRRRNLPTLAGGACMKPLHSILLACCSVGVFCAQPALAVSDFIVTAYDADAGNPANAAAIESPELQGWSEWASTLQGQDPSVAVQEGVIGNDNTNAWLNDDPGETNPGYFFDLSSDVQQAMYDFGWEYEAVVTMTAGGHFTALGVDGNNPWGLPANARVGFAPSTDGSAITFGSVSGGGAADIVTPAGTVGDFYRVVVAGDIQATTGTLSVFDFSDGSQVDATQNYAGWAAGNTLNANRLGIQSGSSGGTGRTMQIHAVELSVAAPDTLTLRVNTNSGAMALVNNSGADVAFNGYFIDSEAGALDRSGWNSLQSQNLEGGTVGQGDGWEEFDASDDNFLGEGFLTGATTVANGESIVLGSAFDPSVFGIGNDGDLTLTLTDALGRQIPSVLFDTIEYFVGDDVPGDFNGDSRVLGADLLIAQRTDPGARIPLWEENYGAGVAASAQGNVPEPTGCMLVLLAGIVVGCLVRQRTPAVALISKGRTMPNRQSWICLAALVIAAGGSSATAEVFNDRDYQLGEDSFGLNVDSQGVDTAQFPAATNTGAFQDLSINGSPTTVSVSDRPGAAGGALGVQFNGAGDSLTSGQSLNAPNQTWNSTTVYPDNGDGYDPPNGVDGPDNDTVYDPPFPHNYSGIFGRGIQLWAKPSPAGLGQSSRQDVVLDTEEHGIYITENDTWGFQFDCDACLVDTEVPVAADTWTHVMHLGGLGDFQGGGTAFDGAMLVNGVAVAAIGGAYDPSTAGISVGSNLASDGNYYNGILDDVRIFLYGDNSDEPANADNTQAGYLGGGDWGSLDLGTDNDWIAQQLASLGVTDPGDVDLNGTVTLADQTAFVADWRKVQTVDGIVVGDWISRSQNSDLNYDGTTNLADAFILHESLQSAGLGGLNFALLGTAVPEPTTAILAIALGIGLVGRTRRQR